MVVKWLSAVVAIATIAWLLAAQGCMRFRKTDKEALREFAAAYVSASFHSLLVEGRTLHYVATGTAGKPTLLFLHGSPGSWSAFETYLKDTDLLKQYYMASLDRPGYGWSDYGRAVSISKQAIWIGTLLDSLKGAGKVVVIGHSLGGPLAVKLAAMYPDKVVGLVLLAASVDPNEEKPERWRPILKAVPLRYFLPGAFRPSNIELWAFKKDVLTMPADLNGIQCPVTILQGTEDSMVPPGNAYYAQKMLKHAQTVKLIPLSGANHFIPWTRFADVKSAILSFNGTK